MKVKESPAVSFDEFWQTVSNYKGGFFINIGNEEGGDHSLELFSAYYHDVNSFESHTWISFSNYNHSFIDEKTGKETLQMEQIGTFAFDTRKIVSIIDLNELDRGDRFEFDPAKAYHIELSDGNDVYIGLCFYGE